MKSKDLETLSSMGKNVGRALPTIGLDFVKFVYFFPTKMREIMKSDPDTFGGGYIFTGGATDVIIPIWLASIISHVGISQVIHGDYNWYYLIPPLVSNVSSGAYEWFKYEKNKIKEKNKGLEAR